MTPNVTKILHQVSKKNKLTNELSQYGFNKVALFKEKSEDLTKYLAFCPVDGLYKKLLAFAPLSPGFGTFYINYVIYDLGKLKITSYRWRHQKYNINPVRSINTNFMNILSPAIFASNLSIKHISINFQCLFYSELVILI